MNWNGRLIVINDIENLQEMPWDNYLDFLFGMIAEDGTLLVGVEDEDPFDESYGQIRVYKCSMKGDEGTLTELKESVRVMLDELRALSKYWKELWDEEVDVSELLKETDLYDAWEKYLKPLPKVEMIGDVAQERLGRGNNAYGVLYRAHRVCHLYALDAKPVITAREERSLAQAMAIHKCCKEMNYEGKVAPVE